MKKTVISLMMAATFMAANGQEKKQEIKVADETFIVINSASTGNLKIKSSNEKISSALLKKFPENIIRYNVAMKKDRFGSYAEYSLYFKKEAEKNIVDFLKSL